MEGIGALKDPAVAIAVFSAALAAAATQALYISKRARIFWASWVPDLQYQHRKICSAAFAVGGFVGAIVYIIVKAVEQSIDPALRVGTSTMASAVSIVLLNITPSSLAEKTLATPLDFLSRWVQWLHAEADTQVQDSIRSTIIRLPARDVAKLCLSIHNMNIDSYKNEEARQGAHIQLEKAIADLRSQDSDVQNEAYGRLQYFAVKWILEFKQTRNECGL